MGRRRKRRNQDRGYSQRDMLKEAGLAPEDELEEDPELPLEEEAEAGPGEAAVDPAPEPEATSPASEPEPAPEATPPASEPEPAPEATPPASDPEPAPFRLESEPVPPPPPSVPVVKRPERWERRVAEQEELGDVEGALEVVREELEADPHDPRLLLREIHLLGSLGRFDEAAEPLRRLRLAEGSTPAVRRAAGVLFFRRGMYPEAEVELRGAIKAGDTSGQSHYYLGEALNRMGNVEEALRILGEALELNPDEVRAYNTLGRLLDRKGLRDEAALMFRKARELGG